MHPEYYKLVDVAWAGTPFTLAQEKELLEHANPDCAFCSGTGIETSYSEDRLVNMANDTFAIIANTLGVDPECGHMNPSDMSDLIEGFHTSKIFKSTKVHYSHPRLEVCEITSDRLIGMLERIQGLIDEATDEEQLSWG
jgi:hypothetical protein